MHAYDRHDAEGFRLGFRLMRLALAACAAAFLLQGALDLCSAAPPYGMGTPSAALACSTGWMSTASHR